MRCPEALNLEAFPPWAQPSSSCGAHPCLGAVGNDQSHSPWGCSFGGSSRASSQRCKGLRRMASMEKDRPSFLGAPLCVVLFSMP